MTLPDNFVVLEDKTREVMEKAHAPYSGYHVGASVITKGGHTHSACNVELKPTTNTLHAEQRAVAEALEEGHNEITHLMLVTSGDDSYPPCGSCRNAIATVSTDIKVLVLTDEGEADLYEIEDLLPHPYT